MIKKFAGAVSAGLLTFGAPSLEVSAETSVDSNCTYTVKPGDTLTKISSLSGVSIQEIADENRIENIDYIFAGQKLDICIDETQSNPQSPETASGILAQQTKLNDLLTPYGFEELVVDGISGPKTEQAHCAGRMLTGQTVIRDDMTPGSTEETRLMSADSISFPMTENQNLLRNASRWILVNQTCQVLVAGEYGSVRFVMPVSTGTGIPDQNGNLTHTRNGIDYAFRFNPASDNNGWHDSTSYPSAIDNPLNGNMYKPIYFDRGQAIHGAMNVPPNPASKGCVRVSVDNQDTLVNWLGLNNYTDQVWNPNNINLLIAREGRYIEDED